MVSAARYQRAERSRVGERTERLEPLESWAQAGTVPVVVAVVGPQVVVDADNDAVADAVASAGSVAPVVVLAPLFGVVARAVPARELAARCLLFAFALFERPSRAS